jgi:hypothetical protein
MKRSAAIEIDGLILALSAQIKTAIRLGCSDVAQILEMSLLALQMRRYGISDAELKAFCDVVKKREAADPSAHLPRAKSGTAHVKVSGP